MESGVLKIKFSHHASDYDVEIGHDLLSRAGKWARKCLGKDAAKAIIVSNPTVFKLYGQQVQESLASAGFELSGWLMKDGERYKSMRSVEQALAFFSEKRLTRT